jgi:hypothetical protein
MSGSQLCSCKTNGFVSCYFVTHWYMLPPLGGTYFHWCRKCSYSTQHHLENGNCTKQVEKGRCTHVILSLCAQNTEPMTIHRQTVQGVWCSCDVHTSVEVVRQKSWRRTEVAVCHQHSHECCGWRDEPLNPSELHSLSHSVGFATLAVHEHAYNT